MQRMALLAMFASIFLGCYEEPGRILVDQQSVYGMLEEQIYGPFSNWEAGLSPKPLASNDELLIAHQSRNSTFERIRTLQIEFKALASNAELEDYERDLARDYGDGVREMLYDLNYIIEQERLLITAVENMSSESMRTEFYDAYMAIVSAELSRRREKAQATEA